MPIELKKVRRIFYYFVAISVTWVFYLFFKRVPQPELGFWAAIVLGSLVLLGLSDIFQKKQTIRRNFPLLGHFRYLLEEVRPEIQQYFIATDESELPFNRETRSIVYQRSKNVRDTVPFGTDRCFL